MIGGRRPLQGRKPADRRVRVERPHSAYFRYTGPGQMVAKAAAHDAARRPLGRACARSPRRRDRAAAGERGGDRRAPVEAEGARDLQLGRDQLLRLRDRGDPAGPRPRRRRGACLLSVEVAAAIAVLLAVVAISLPPGLPGVPERRRRVRVAAGDSRRCSGSSPPRRSSSTTS